MRCTIRSTRATTRSRLISPPRFTTNAPSTQRRMKRIAISHTNEFVVIPSSPPPCPTRAISPTLRDQGQLACCRLPVSIFCRAWRRRHRRVPPPLELAISWTPDTLLDRDGRNGLHVGLQGHGHLESNLHQEVRDG